MLSAVPRLGSQGGVIGRPRAQPPVDAAKEIEELPGPQIRTAVGNTLTGTFTVHEVVFSDERPSPYELIVAA